MFKMHSASRLILLVNLPKGLLDWAGMLMDQPDHLQVALFSRAATPSSSAAAVCEDDRCGYSFIDTTRNQPPLVLDGVLR
jgi:hypothetical protein